MSYQQPYDPNSLPPTQPYSSPPAPYSGAPYAGQPYSGQPYSGQPYSGAPYSGPPAAGPVYYPTPMVVVSAPVVPSSGAATASLVFGIIGIVGGWCLLGIPCILAVVFGHIGLSATKDNQRQGRGMAVAGLVMGYICVIPAVLVTILIFGSIFFAAQSPSTTSY